LELNGGKWSASHPICFTLRERTPSTLWIGGWEGTKAGLDAVARRKKSQPLLGIKPLSSSP